MEGRVGIGPMPALEQRPNPDKGGGQAVDLPPELHADLPRAARHLRCAIDEALAQAGFASPQGGAGVGTRIAAALGTTLHGMRAAGEFLRSGDHRRLRSFLAGSVLDDALAGLAVGPVRFTTCSACSSGLGSVALGVTLLHAGAADAVVVGGYDAASEYVYAGFDSLRVVALGMPRPFDAERDGMKVAEGYGALVIESAAHAAARGAEPLALIAGIGESSDSFHLTQPHPAGEGAARAIANALAEAGIEPKELDMVASHATSTPNNDAAEYRALSHTFGALLATIPVVAFKGHIGHTLGAAGAVELALSIMAMRGCVVPPTMGTVTVDPAFNDLRLVLGKPLRRSVRAAANLSLGFGGANTCVVLTNPKYSVGSKRGEAVAAEVLITGVGVVLPGMIGPGIPGAMRETMGTAAPLARAIADSEFEHLMTARRSRRMSEYAKLSVAAAVAACTDAALVPGGAELSGSCAILGTTHGSSAFCEEYYQEIVAKGLGAANPALFAEGVPNAAAAHLSMALGLRGGCQTIIGTRCAGMTALILAAMRVRSGMWVRAIVVGGEAFSLVVNTAYERCGGLSPGMAAAGSSGAVGIVLESERVAAARGIRKRGGLVSWAWGRGLAELDGSLGEPVRVWSALSNSGSDADAISGLHRGTSGRRHSSVRDQLPECFSAGPLAALVRGLAEGPGEFGVVAREFSGGSCGVRVTATSAISGAAVN